MISEIELRKLRLELLVVALNVRAVSDNLATMIGGADGGREEPHG